MPNLFFPNGYVLKNYEGMKKRNTQEVTLMIQFVLNLEILLVNMQRSLPPLSWI